MIRVIAVVHCDETRHQRGNENRWMWQVCTAELSCFMTHFSRGAWAAKKLLGDNPENIVVTDQYAGYHYRFRPPSIVLGAYLKKHECAGGKLGNEQDLWNDVSQAHSHTVPAATPV